MTDEQSRIGTNPSGQLRDEALDAVYNEIYEHWPDISADDKQAFATLIDPYIQSLNGAVDIGFFEAINDLDRAICWATNFGTLSIYVDRDGSAINLISPEHRSKAKVFACTGPSDQAAFGICVHQAVLLAGLLVLRQIAAQILNQADATAH